MTTTLTPQEWERRFRERFVERAIAAGATKEEADVLVQTEWESTTIDDHAADFENDPEEAANVCLSYYTDGL